MLVQAAEGLDRWWVGPVATVLGVLVAQLVVISLYFANRRGDDKRRWHERRLETYSALALAVRDVIRLLALPKDDDRDAKLDEATDRAGIAAFDVALLSTTEVRRAADVLIDAANVHRRTVKPDEWQEHVSTLVDAKVAFDNAVRKELGVSRPKRRLVVEANGAFGLLAHSFVMSGEVLAKSLAELPRAIFGIRIFKR